MTQIEYVRFKVDGEKDALFVGWPPGDGVFGELALARCQIANGKFLTIEFVRFMTPDEVERMRKAPYSYWHEERSPAWQPDSPSWAMRLCQPKVLGQSKTATTHQRAKRAGSGDQRVGV